MFKVNSLGSSFKGLNSIMSGSNFGTPDQPIAFYLNASGIDVPLRLNFRVSRDTSKGTAFFQVGDIFDNTINLDFYNAATTGGSGLRHPVALVTVNGVTLSIMFQVDTYPGALFYKVTYEFFQSAQINWEAP